MQPSDERRHEPSDDATTAWAETWEFDFFSPDGSLGGWSALTLWPKENAAWYHAFLAGPGRDLVAVVDHQVPLPPSSLEFRTHGLWASHICETPFDHWTIGLEAFGVGLDDPAEMYGRQLGDQVALGFDLEWEAEADPPLEILDAPAGDGYWQGCRVSGEILVGEGAIDFDGNGARHHRWGPATPAGAVRVTARLDDGEWVAAETGPADRDPGSPAVAPTGPTGGHVAVRGGSVDVEPSAVTPLAIPAASTGQRRTPRALCEVLHSDGRTGWGWITYF